MEDWADSILSTLEVNLDKFLTAVKRGRERLHERSQETVVAGIGPEPIEPQSPKSSNASARLFGRAFGGATPPRLGGELAAHGDRGIRRTPPRQGCGAGPSARRGRSPRGGMRPWRSIDLDARVVLVDREARRDG